MKKELRLRKSLDFRKTFKEGKRFLSPHFVLYIRKTGSGQSRLGVSLSKSHFKLATTRNRLRRIAKEFFRNEINPRLKGFDLAVSSKRSTDSADIGKTADELKKLLLRSKE